MKRCDLDIHGLKCRCADLCQNNTYGLVIQLLDTGNICCCITGLNTFGSVCIYVFRNQIGESASCRLSLHSGEAPSVLVTDCHKEILSGRICRKTVEAPLCCCACYVALFADAVLYAVINDFLCKCCTTVVYSIPECVLLIFCPVCEVCVILARCRK